MDIYLFLYNFGILILKTLADEFCQQNLDGLEECEGNINKDPEVQFLLSHKVRAYKTLSCLVYMKIYPGKA